MKILHMINSLNTGGAEKLLLDSIPLYKEKGISVDILVLWDNNSPFLKELSKLNCCSIYVLKKSNNYKDIYSLSLVFKIREIIKEYDIVHSHLFPSQYFLILANLGGVNKKLIFTEHSTSNRRVSNFLFRMIDSFFYRRYRYIVYISDEVRNIFIKFYPFLKNNSVVIKNGVSLRKINEALPYEKNFIDEKINKNDVIVLQVSAFRHQKDQKTLIKSMKYLGENVKLVLVGDGLLKRESENYVKKLPIEKRVFFLGQRMDVPQLLKTADIVVLSSKYEGLSLSSVEGLASGKPFVASDVPGLHDIVDGAGILFKQGNDRQLASIIQRLIDTPDYAEEIGMKGIERAREYDIQNMVDEHISLYKKVYEEN